MDDNQIVELFWSRDERAIAETSAKYGSLCRKIAYGILANTQDSEEIVNSSYFQLWNAIPPKRPDPLSAFLARVVRNLALNKLKADHAQKRYSGEFTVSLDELDECVPDKNSAESDAIHIRDCLNSFLREQKRNDRCIFVLRYFNCYSIEEIAQKTGYSQSRVKSVLFRMRGRLKVRLEKEGISI